MSGNQRGLGRGLGELFQRTEIGAEPVPPVKSAELTTEHQPESAPQPAPHPVPEGSYFAEIPLTQIRANPKQPRTVFDEETLTELVDSIDEVGLLQPIVVRPLDLEDVSNPDGQSPEDTSQASETSDEAVKFELVMGERRWRAARRSRLTAIPAIVRRTEDHDLLRDALLENLHRTQLNPLEEAAAYQQMLDDFDCTQEELAHRIKRSRPQISNTIRLLRLPPTVQRRVAAGVLSAGHARALVAIADQLSQERMAQRIVAEGLSVRATEELVTLGDRQAEQTEPRRSRGREPSEHAVAVGGRLSERFDTRVRVDIGKNKGKITIEFAGRDDLERLIGLLDPTEVSR